MGERISIAADDAPITPRDFSPPDATRPRRRWRPPPSQIATVAVVLGGGLLLWFLFGVRAVELRPDPVDAEVSIRGGVQIRIGRRVLLRPGHGYEASASAEGYNPLERDFMVDDSANQRLELALVPLPGKLALHTTPVAAQVLIDGAHIGSSNGELLEVPAGAHTLRLEAERYLALEQSLQVEGKGREQALDLALAPGFGTYRFDTEPAGASVLHDGTDAGTTPLDLELMAGTRALRIVLEGYRDESLVVEATAGEQRALDPLVLVRADARVHVSTRPDGASLTLDGEFRGSAPVDLALESGTAHELVAFKAGYERAVRHFTAQRGVQDLRLELPVLAGEIRIVVQPADAEILAGTRSLARGSATVSLPSVPQRLTVRRAGYASQELEVTPRPGFAQEVQVKLQTAQEQRTSGQPAQVKTGIGQELVLLTPAAYRMGSSRRENGRRANEAIHQVKPRRPFYIGVTEVTNAEFRQFRSAHSSGNFKGKSLNGNDQPAVMIGWSDAALFCNWLSARDGLQPFYRMAGKAIIGAEPRSTGYRLPSEAEWAWAATVQADASQARFPWGENMPPPTAAGNYADKSGAGLLGAAIADYDDGFAVAAPARRFAPNRNGLFDIGGNAAEWVHDLYEAAPPAGAPVDDPLGPDIGEYHVIRGASWRHGGITELRLAYRDYGKDGRADVGFRIARYAQ